MTPKEKADEILDKMRDSLDEDNGTGSGCRGCAIVAVDEILSMGIMSDSGDWRMARQFWEEVKEELLKS